MSKTFEFRAKAAMEAGFDGDGILDLGRVAPEDSGPAVEAEPVGGIPALGRVERERIPAKMAAELMDFFVETLNDMTMMNPIRDGIPECRNHRFLPKQGQYGCTQSCAKFHPELAMPVIRDYTLGDVYEWVKLIVNGAVRSGELLKGYTRPTTLTE
jgi:hypothetical protein